MYTVEPLSSSHFAYVAMEFVRFRRQKGPDNSECSKVANESPEAFYTK